MLTGGLEAFDVSGSLQEVAAQVHEEEEEGHHGDEDPGNHWGCYSDDPENLQEHLLTRQTEPYLLLSRLCFVF